MTNKLEFSKFLNLFLLFAFLFLNYTLDAQVFRKVQSTDSEGGDPTKCISSDSIKISFDFLLKDLNDPSFILGDDCDLHFGIVDDWGFPFLDSNGDPTLFSWEDAKQMVNIVQLGKGKYVYQGRHTTNPIDISLYKNAACSKTESEEAYFNINLGLYCIGPDGSMTPLNLCEETEFVSQFIFTGQEFDCTKQEGGGVKVCCPDDNNDDVASKSRNSLTPEFGNITVSSLNNLIKINSTSSFSEKVIINVFNLNGQKVYSGESTPKNNIIRLNDLNLVAGAYIINLQNEIDAVSIKYIHMK